MRKNDVYVGRHTDPNTIMHAKYIRKVRTPGGKWRYIYDKKDLTTVHMKPTYNGTSAPFTGAPTGGLHHWVTSATVDSQGNIVSTSGFSSRKKVNLWSPNAPKSKGVKRRGKGLGTGPVGPNVQNGSHASFNSLAYQKRKANVKQVRVLTALHKLDKQQKKAEAEAQAKKARSLSKKLKDSVKSAYEYTGVKQKKTLNRYKKTAGYKKLGKVDYAQKQYDKTLLGKAEKKLKRRTKK